MKSGPSYTKTKELIGSQEIVRATIPLGPVHTDPGKFENDTLKRRVTAHAQSYC